MERFARHLAPYLATLACLAVCTAGILLLNNGAARATFNGVILLVILGSAWWGGYGPGVLAAIATLTVVSYVVVPNFSASKINITQVVQILLISMLTSRMAASRNEREAVLRESNDLLDERVRLRTAELEQANASLQEREALLIQQADELARSNADLQQFAYLASHDLQEPLRMVAVYSELLKRRYAGHLDEEADRLIAVITDGARRMEALIRDVMSYSHVIHAERLPEGEHTDAGESLQLAMATLELSIKESGCVIHFDPLPTLPCGRLQLMQVFQNLLSNAIKYRGAQVPQIHVSAETRDNEWVFSVKDNGIGIEPEYHELIFTPFKRLHGREYPGTGIGLALCRRIVDRNGGRIWVESQAGQGSTFRFSVPLESQTSRIAVRSSIGIP